MKTYAYGFPKLGRNREFKKNVEDFWKSTINEQQLVEALNGIQNENIRLYKQSIDVFPEGELSAYDFMLDAAILFGVYDPKDLREYYELCRGANALEMTKWFNTNYHYLVPDFHGFMAPPFKLNKNNPALSLKQAGFPQLIGPFTFLKLSKGIDKNFFRPLFLSLVKVYAGFLSQHRQIQLDEPGFVLELNA